MRWNDRKLFRGLMDVLRNVGGKDGRLAGKMSGDNQCRLNEFRRILDEIFKSALFGEDKLIVTIRQVEKN